MISAPDRRETLQLIEDAVAAGARRAQACAELGLSLRSLQRWQHCPEDRRPSAQRAEPANKLTPQERRRVLEVANQPEFASLPPQQIVARLADQGTWLASESTFYRLLKDAEQQHPRGRSRPPVKRALTTHVADGPNQLWCWDITWLPTTVKGCGFHAIRPHSPRSSGRAFHAHLAICSTTIRTGSRSAATQGWHCYSEVPGVVNLFARLRIDSPLRLIR